jgi:hypothetical protein
MYDTRHAVFRPARMSAESLEVGYWRAYREFYRWSSIWSGAMSKPVWSGRLRHLAYAGGWKKFEPLWDWVIRARRVTNFLPLLEQILEGFRTPMPISLDHEEESLSPHNHSQGKPSKAY